MYLSIGNDMAVRESSLIGIFDLDNTTTSRRTRDFLAYAQKNGAVVSLSEELPKSFILTDSPVETVYLSPLSPASLKRRAEKGPGEPQLRPDSGM